MRYALYSVETTRSRYAYLVTVMLDAKAAELHADALCAAMGYAAVEVRSYPDGPTIPERIEP